jgi:hypothetical protein
MFLSRPVNYLYLKMKTTLSQKPWTFGKRLRTLLGIYFLFLILDFTSSDELFPHFIYGVFNFYTNFWNWAVPFTGDHILQVPYPITVKPNGSGDTTYNYVLQLLWIVFSIVIASIWAFLDRKRPSYQQFQYWLRIIVRYFLAFMLFVYGFVKVIKLQFPEPSLYRLLTPYGESTPMGLAWTFIGYSKGYNIFIGGAEVMAGMLLFFKRTTLFGALVAMTVMANVAAMNFAYDIPVKIFSINLFAMALWLAWFDKDRLINFFFLNKETKAASIEYLYRTKWKKIIQLSLKSIAIIFAFYATLIVNLKSAAVYGDAAPKPPLYGIYDVEDFTKNGQQVPPLTTDYVRWKRVVINYQGRIGIFNMSDSLTRMKFDLDSVKKTMTFTSDQDSTLSYTLKYQKLKNDYLLLNGTFQNDTVAIKMKRFDHQKMPLLKTGFNWINEYPNNR